MAFSHIMITGDCHGQFSRFKNLPDEFKKDPNAAVIILGDVGFNTLKQHDCHKKNEIKKRYQCQFYCLRGNHEARPEDEEDMKLVYDDTVKGFVRFQPQYPTIHYLVDGWVYDFNGYKVLTIGGAYSVDKQYRIAMNWPWFPNEQLSAIEMEEIAEYVKGQEVDFVLTHTCPVEWEPTDLFLGSINQSTVDKSMEKWMDEIKSTFKWNVWLFGHFHADRLELPHVEMFYEEMEDIETIVQRWKKYDETKELDWWLPKSPKFYMFTEQG